MKIVCSGCGEELIGNVNRCWRCGTPFTPVDEVPTAMANIPSADSPIDAIPVAYLVPDEPADSGQSGGESKGESSGNGSSHSADANEAGDNATGPSDGPESPGAQAKTTSSDQTETAAGADQPNDSVSASEDSGDSGADTSASAQPQTSSKTEATKSGPAEVPPRRGSPFRAEHTQSLAMMGDDIVMPSYPDNVLRENLAVASVVVGVMSLLATIATPWALIPSSIGLGLGILGLQSERRKTAIVGIVIALIGVLFGTWKTIDAIQTYMHLNELQQMDELMDY